MFSFVLSLHSITRWAVLFALIAVIVKSTRGWIFHKKYTNGDNKLRIASVIICHIQLLIGVVLYGISPTIKFLFHNSASAMKIRNIRFFGMEHSVMMIISIVLITIGSINAKKASTDQKKFKVLSLWYSLALLIILLMIPWPFSPLAQRPFLR
ncbi:hypothetical protein [Rhizosphaericola mali]|uniref:Cytochrome B n=1 Tax=Rhizosphaericola mali TaxID=2545455 RepID=A0A5P2G1D4_9BACT|nr:hypothetical protein [Rhizosphaericola mali]QES87642.1 hypothetical protein E0W69_002810 [Rhizosphaericola mali]